MSKESEIGTLIVVVLKARNLNDKHKFRKQDAFAKILLNGLEKQTQVEIKGGQHPVWDEEFRFPIMRDSGKKFRTLEISCWAKEPRSEDIVGKGTIDITETLQTGEFDDWVPLSIDGVTRGDLYLEMTYYANGPPPTASPVQVQTTPTPMKQALAVPQASGNLMRRPSKFSPAERLSRPPTVGQTPPANRRTSVPPVFEQRTPIPTAPQPVPNLLRPGAVPRPISDPSLPTSPTRPNHSHANSTPGPNPNPYLVARPGSEITQQQPYNRPASASPAVQATNPYLAGNTPTPYLYNNSHTSPPPLLAQNPYTQQHNIPTFSHTPGPQQPPPARTPVPDGPPLIWAAGPTDHQSNAPPASSFSFPAPSIPGGMPGGYPEYGPHTAAPWHQAHYRRASDPRDDPSLNIRYQTPLPLPPGTKPTSPPPAPQRQISPPPAPLPPSPPAPKKQPTPAPDKQRVEQLKWAEEEAARRREQEIRDLELAMQLDKELNL